MNMLEILLEYKLFLIPIIVIVFAQLLKFLRLSLKHGYKVDNLFDPGHFPSAHSAFVSSLIVTIGYFESVTSGVFAVATCFAFLTIYDAMRVRMHIGLQGKALNKLVHDIDSVNEKEFPRLKEHVGHYANEVAGGIFIGTVLTIFLIWTVT
ncbi:MAG: divergent PAP2 family protein [Patescibacteria group bacterium]